MVSMTAPTDPPPPTDPPEDQPPEPREQPARPPISADDFGPDNPPNRQQCRQLLVEASYDAKKIEAWNELRKRMGWQWEPDLSDKKDCWDACDIGLSVLGEGAERITADLQKAHLEGADLMLSSLKGVHLSYANLEGAVLRDTTFRKQPKTRRIFIRVYRMCIKYIRKGRWHALRRVLSLLSPEWGFIDTFISGRAGLGDSDTFTPSTVLDNVDLHGNTGFTAHGQSARGTRFDPAAKDPYSILRRKYTGPLMLFTLVFLAMFFTPYLIRAGAWTAASRVQTALVVADDSAPKSWPVLLRESSSDLQHASAELRATAQSQSDLRELVFKWTNRLEAANANIQLAIDRIPGETKVAVNLTNALEGINAELMSTVSTLGSTAGATEASLLRASDAIAELSERLNTHAQTTKRQVWSIVLGFRAGFWGWLAGVLSIIFLFYNVLRACVTWWMSQVRDAEERSGHLPEIQQYWWCFSLHRFVLQPIFIFAVFSFVWHTILWLKEEVDVPIQFLQ